MDIEKFFYNIIRAGLFLILFVPLYINKASIFPFVVPKTMAFVIIVEALLIFYLPLAFFSKRYRPKTSSLFWAVTVMFAVVILASIIGINPYKSFWSTFERMGGVFVFVHYYAFFLILVGVLKRRDEWFYLMRGAVTVGIIMSLYGIGQKIGISSLVESGVSRVGGTIGNPIFLAAFLMFSLAFAIILITDHKENIGWKYIYGFAIGVETLTIIFTASRGVIIGILGGLFVFATLYLLFHKKTPYRKYFVGVIIFLVFFVIFLFAVRNTQFINNVAILDRLSTVFRGFPEIQARVYAWEIGLNGWQERFLLGWGAENYNVVYNKYFNPLTMVSAGSEVWFDRAHNIIFDWAINSGFAGLSAYLVGTLFLPLYLLYRLMMKREDENFVYYAVPFTFLVAYFFQNLFVFEMVSSYLMFFLMLAFICYLTTEIKNDLAVNNQKTARKKYNFIRPSLGVAVITAIIFIIVFFKIDIKILRAADSAGQATQTMYYSLIDPTKVSAAAALNLVQESLAYNTFGNAELRMRLVNYIVQVSDRLIFSNNADQASAEKIASYLNYALGEVQKNIDKYPDDVRHYLDRGRLNIKLGLIDKANNSEYFKLAEEAYNKALALSPGRQQVYYELINLYMVQGRIEEALVNTNKAIDLNPVVPESHWNKAVTLANMDRWSEAAQESDRAIELNLIGYRENKDYLLLMRQIYINVKNNNRLVDVYSALVDLDQLNVEWYEMLAQSYYELGQKDKAEETAERMLVLNPLYQDRVDELLEQFK